MQIKDTIKIASDFSETPGARFISDGPFSAELFYNELLINKFEKAVREEYILLIDLDDVWGYPSSFISGAFGKLSIEKGADLVLKHIEFQSTDSEIKKMKFIQEIKNPRRE